MNADMRTCDKIERGDITSTQLIHYSRKLYKIATSSNYWISIRTNDVEWDGSTEFDTMATRPADSDRLWLQPLVL